MPLPIIETPKYEAKLPSTGKKFLYRPYLVKEEQILMIAGESGDPKQIMQAVKDVIVSCTFGKVNPDEIPVFDLEYLFLKLRSKSVGEVSKVNIKCDKCETANPVSINLEEINVDMTTQTKPFVQITDRIALNLRYPGVDVLTDMAEKSAEEQKSAVFDLVVSCIESIIDDQKVYKAEDHTREELTQFMESLNQEQFKKIQDFIERMPRLQHEVKFTCRQCSHENLITVTGLKNFF
jgi:rubrerythrin